MELISRAKKEILRREKQLQDETHLEDLHPVLQRIFSARGVDCPSDLERTLQHLLPYDKLMNIDVATDLLYDVLKEQKRIMIVGDFDADGATSTAVAVSALQQMGAKHVDFLVPNRFAFGYGLSPEIVDVASDSQPDLIITVDNGISSCEGVARANEKGIAVLVTDHHLPGRTLPEAAAIINPNQEGDSFPSKNLAGVGVIFYVMLALRGHLRAQQWFAGQQIPEPNMAQLLDLVALGTVADVVPLDSNNRILVHQGLLRIRKGFARPGIKALLQIAKKDEKHLVASDMGFALGPRLNAAGRLDDMSVGIACLLSKSLSQGVTLAKRLDALNGERKLIENTMQQQAFEAIRRLNLSSDLDTLPLGICLYDESWHQGVIGIVAGRLKEYVHRPVIAFAKASDNELKGSARSIPGLHIRDVIDSIASKHPKLINKFGGHAMAAGLSLAPDNYDAFAKAYVDELANWLNKDDLQSVIYTDGQLNAKDLCAPLAKLLREAGPWGQAFPEPLFDGEFILIQQRLVGGKHLKLVLGMDNSDKYFDAIAFGVDLNQWPNFRCEKIRAVYRLDLNLYKNQQSLQLMLEYFEAL